MHASGAYVQAGRGGTGQARVAAPLQPFTSASPAMQSRAQGMCGGGQKGAAAPNRRTCRQGTSSVTRPRHGGSGAQHEDVTCT
eukprot:2848317-Prymnesium_polylepis.1